jgi:hypothetical protein
MTMAMIAGWLARDAKQKFLRAAFFLDTEAQREMSVCGETRSQINRNIIDCRHCNCCCCCPKTLLSLSFLPFSFSSHAMRALIALKLRRTTFNSERENVLNVIARRASKESRISR